MIDARGQESHFESWMTQNEGICDAIDALKALDKQEPVAWMFQHDETGRMNYVSNDGIHDPTMFLGMNPRYALVCPLYTTPPQRKTFNHHEFGFNGSVDVFGFVCTHQPHFNFVLQLRYLIIRQSYPCALWRIRR